MPVNVTHAAAAVAKALLDRQEHGPNQFVRLTLKPDGGLGLSLDVAREGDHVVTYQETKVMVVGQSVREALSNTTIDVSETPEGRSLIKIESEEPSEASPGVIAAPPTSDTYLAASAMVDRMMGRREHTPPPPREFPSVSAAAVGSGTWGRDEGDVPVELEGSKVPSLWHYAAAAVCAVTGLVVAIVLVVTPVIGNLPDIQVVMPGEHEIVLEDGGGYTIFYEYSGQVDPRVYSSLGGLQGLGITVRPKAGFSKVELSRPSGSSEYQPGFPR